MWTVWYLCALILSLELRPPSTCYKVQGLWARASSLTCRVGLAQSLLWPLSRGWVQVLGETGTWTLGHWLPGPRPHCSAGVAGRRGR